MNSKTLGYSKLNPEINTTASEEYMCIENCSLKPGKKEVTPGKANLAITPKLIPTSDLLMNISGVLGPRRAHRGQDEEFSALEDY